LPQLDKGVVKACCAVGWRFRAVP